MTQEKRLGWAARGLFGAFLFASQGSLGVRVARMVPVQERQTLDGEPGERAEVGDVCGDHREAIGGCDGGDLAVDEQQRQSDRGQAGALGGVPGAAATS